MMQNSFKVSAKIITYVLQMGIESACSWNVNFRLQKLG